MNFRCLRGRRSLSRGNPFLDCEVRRFVAKNNPRPVPVKTKLLLSSALLSVTLLSGCATTPNEQRITNPQQPGPAVGTAVGTVVGTVTGQVTGAVVAGGEATAAAVKAPFTNERRIVRRWRTETTADGRTIQVPYEVEVDAQGRVIEPPKN